jgi:hypothetical protein
MGNPEIKNRFTGNIIIPAGKYTSIKEAVEKEYKNLSGANLSWANLSWANLSEANLSRADLSEANLSEANLSRANLSRADLSEANLSGANLSWANLSWANLSEANLSRADLSEANLSRADLKKIPSLNTPTINEYIKKFKIEKKGEYIYVFKGVTEKLESPTSSVKIKYTKGTHEVKYADCNVWADCSYGISVSPTEATAKKWGSKILKVKVHIGDIVCIPVYGHEKKFRVKKLTVATN